MSELLKNAKSFYALALSDPQKACADYLADNFVLENYLPDIIPFGGRYEGASGFLQYLQELSAAIDMGPLHMEQWVSGDNEVIVRGTEGSLVRSTGLRYEMRFVHWLSFDPQGRITNMREYNDTAAMQTAFQGNDR